MRPAVSEVPSLSTVSFSPPTVSFSPPTVSSIRPSAASTACLILASTSPGFESSAMRAFTSPSP